MFLNDKVKNMKLIKGNLYVFLSDQNQIKIEYIGKSKAISECLQEPMEIWHQFKLPNTNKLWCELKESNLHIIREVNSADNEEYFK